MKISIFFLAVILLITSGCNSKSGNKLKNKSVAETSDSPKSTDPIPVVKKDPLPFFTLQVIEFGLTEFVITKEAGEGGLTEYGEFTISFKTDSASSLDRVMVREYKSEGEGVAYDGIKEIKNLYKLLQNTKANELEVFYFLLRNTVDSYEVGKLNIKEKRTPGKDGLPAKVIPEVTVWQK